MTQANLTEEILFNKIQILLAEKRTSLSILRTGIAVLALPLSILSALIATSKYYDFMNVIHLIIPVLSICVLLLIFGIYLIFRSFFRIKNYDSHIAEIKSKDPQLNNILD